MNTDSPSSWREDPIDAALRRIQQTVLNNPPLPPLDETARQHFRQIACNGLGIHERFKPTIEARIAATYQLGDVTLQCIVAQSWPGVTATAHLFIPQGDGPHPAVLLCCGHGGGGKMSPGYHSMARHLCQQGFVVLCHDNLGQGERMPMGHANVTGPFQVGLSLQGLIITEATAWLDWLQAHPLVDAQRTAAIGNSGGGTLTTFLAALRPELAALSSSGYPCTFEFIASKEKKFCHCNLLPGVLGKVDIWQLLACFAPKPLLVMQGKNDILFPLDIFHRITRRIRNVYTVLDGTSNLQVQITAGSHSWEADSMQTMAKFLTGSLGLAWRDLPVQMVEQEAIAPLACFSSWPEDALTTDAMASQITGVSCDSAKPLWEIYPPRVENVDTIRDTAMRGNTRQILAQYEVWLTGPLVASPPSLPKL